MTAPSMALPAQPAARECKRPAYRICAARSPCSTFGGDASATAGRSLMDERSLRDLGLTRYDALYEARKPFWRE